MRLIKSADLADDWDMDQAELLRAVRRNGWPCVRLKRSDVRFTEQQVEQIIAMQSRTTSPIKKALTTGQTARSKKAS